MEINSSEEQKVNEKAKQLVNGTFSQIHKVRTKATINGSMIGLFSGLLYSVAKNKSKITYSVLGCFLGYTIGYAYSEIIKDY